MNRIPTENVARGQAPSPTATSTHEAVAPALLDQWGRRWVRFDPTQYKAAPGVTRPIGTALDHDVQLAGDVADEADVAFTDLPMLEAAEQALADIALLTASVLELRERLWAGAFGSDARFDLGTDVYDLAARVQTFALAVHA